MKKVIKDLEFVQEIEKIEGFEMSNTTILTNENTYDSGSSTDKDEDATSDTD